MSKFKSLVVVVAMLVVLVANMYLSLVKAQYAQIIDDSRTLKKGHACTAYGYTSNMTLLSVKILIEQKIEVFQIFQWLALCQGEGSVPVSERELPLGHNHGHDREQPGGLGQLLGDLPLRDGTGGRQVGEAHRTLPLQEGGPALLHGPVGVQGRVLHLPQSRLQTQLQRCDVPRQSHPLV